jgi:all-trans-8'-apo-beta-carotenal 15,15'-oxygenase
MTIDIPNKKIANIERDTRYAVEFPVVSDKLVGKDWSVTYAAMMDGDMKIDGFYNSVIKYNRKTKAAQVKNFGQENSVSEPILIESKERNYLITVVYQSDKNKSWVYLLDEKTLDEVCVLELPEVIPPGYHGRWDYDRIA